MAESPLILIVDDEASFREIFHARLTAAGYRAETAENGQEGLEKAKALRPDLVLMDVKMPGMEGTEAASKMHDDPDLKDLKIVFLTSLGDPSAELSGADSIMAQEFGFQGYIKKTDDADVMLEKVKQFLA
jgi:CheY-like chemotaxis protein